MAAMRPVRAFTLIELLIVVAIIAILAAIAVPNFLEAQTRAKVTRAVSDMRVLAGALETYYLDHNAYPLPWDNGRDGNQTTYPAPGTNPRYDAIRVVTAISTPIAYVSDGQLRDPFALDTTDRELANFFQFGIGTAGETAQNTARMGNIRSGNFAAVYPLNQWVILSFGPDVGIGPQLGDQTTGLTRYPTGTRGLHYDPTNGTISYGDIYRFGPSDQRPANYPQNWH